MNTQPQPDPATEAETEMDRTNAEIVPSRPTGAATHPTMLIWPVVPRQIPSPEDGTEARAPSLEITLTRQSVGSETQHPWIDAREPASRAAPSEDLVMLHAPHSIAAQQFRALRYRVEQEPDAQIYTVISPRVDEGKSITAANLALALAEGGRVKVLLIDAALRSPSQANLFGLKPGPGLTSAIASHDGRNPGPVSVVQITQGLFILPAGPRAVSPHAVLASAAAARLLGSLRRAFRYIIV